MKDPSSLFSFFLLLCSDIQLREIIKSLNDSEDPKNRFLLSETPGGGLFVKSDKVDYVQQRVKQYFDALQFEPKKET